MADLVFALLTNPEHRQEILRQAKASGSISKYCIDGYEIHFRSGNIGVCIVTGHEETKPKLPGLF